MVQRKTAKSRKIEKVMHEFKEGHLRSSSGAMVRKRDQAIAIALSEAGLPRKRRRDSKRP